MPRPYRGESCRRCGVERERAGGLSRAGYCAECSTTAVVENARQLAAHSGPYFDHWRARVGAAVGARAASPGAPKLAEPAGES